MDLEDYCDSARLRSRSKLILRLYKSDPNRYGFILADFMIADLLKLRKIFCDFLYNDQVWHFSVSNSIYVVTWMVGVKSPLKVHEIDCLFTLAKSVYDESSYDKMMDKGVHLRNQVKCWVDNTTDLQEQLHKSLIDNPNADLNVLHIGGSTTQSSVCSGGNPTETTDFLLDLSKDKDKYQDEDDTDELPWMRFFATQNSLREERKEVLQKLYIEQNGDYCFIPSLYQDGMGEPLRIVTIKLLRSPEMWIKEHLKHVLLRAKLASELSIDPELIFSEIKSLAESVLKDFESVGAMGIVIGNDNWKDLVNKLELFLEYYELIEKDSE